MIATLDGSAASWTYTEPTVGLSVRVRGCRLHSDGRLTASLRFSSESTGLRIPGSGVVNLSAPATRNRLAKDLEEAHPTGLWTKILDDLYLRLQDQLLEGEPAVEVLPSTDSLNVKYLLDPILPDGVPTILYGLGGVGKGWIALLLARAVVTGAVPQGFPIAVSRTGPVLYCDWEDSEAGFRGRWTRVAGPDSRHRITYRRCTRPLAEDLDYLVGLVAEMDPELVILDSAGLAAGQDLNTPESAIDLFRGIRALSRTTLLLAHCPKNTTGTVFGSAYFTNLARSVWEVRSESDADTGDLVLGLAHRKCNVSRLRPPFGVALSIGDTVETRTIDLAGSEMATMETLGGRVRHALAEGAMAAAEIAAATGIPQNAVRATLSRLYSKSQVVRLSDGRWGIAARGADDAKPRF